MKKALLVLILFLVLAVAWYLISPLFRVVEVNEPLPFDVEDSGMMRDIETIEPAMREEFGRQMEAMSKKVMEKDEAMPEGPTIAAEGAFMPHAHDVEGVAKLVEQGENRIIRFEDFETVNGPNLHIYLASDLDSEDYIDLGPIKATKGNVNYEVDSAIDLEKYNKVLVWCVPFKVLFSYAELTELP